MTDPIQIMDEIECCGKAPKPLVSEGPAFHPLWQSLRTALEAQAEREAQKEARIAHLETQVQGLEFHISTRPSAAALKAEALREVAALIDGPAHNDEFAKYARELLLGNANRIERGGERE